MKETNNVFSSVKEFGLIYLKVFLHIGKGFSTFIFKGSRGSRKTTVIVKYIIKTMIKDPQASFVVVMETKTQHSETTMREFEKWIDEYCRKWPGFDKKWEKSDSQVSKKYRFYNNGNIQEIKFVALDELSKGTLNPPKRNYWRGMWMEEPVSSKEQYGIDIEAKSQRYDAIKTFELGAVRFFNVARKQTWETTKEFEKRTKNLKLIKFFSFNPYNDEEPLLENFNKYLPDNEKILKEKGYQFFANKELGEVYMTSNYLLNPYLPPQAIEKYNQLAKENYEYYKVAGLGMTGKPINNTYSDIWDIIISYQHTPKPTSWSNFKVSIDVGNGGEGKMTIILLARTHDGIWYPIEEWDDSKWRLKHKFDSDEVALYMIGKLAEWEKKYFQLKNRERILIMDNDTHFKSVFIKAYQTFFDNGNKLRTRWKPHLFKEKYLKDYNNEDRIAIFKYAFSSQRLRIMSDWTPTIYTQFKNHRTKDNGKVIGGNDDARQALEMGIFHNLGEILQTQHLDGRIIDKEVVKFIEKNKY